MSTSNPPNQIAEAGAAIPAYLVVGGSAVSSGNPLPTLGSGGSLSDVLLTDSTGALFIARDTGTTITYHNMNTNAAYTPVGTIQVADTLAQGTDNTGVSQPASGSGVRGWLSAIYSKLLGTLLTNDAPLASIIDSTTTAGYVYFLQAQPGTSTATAAWQVSRLQKSNSQVTWANGNANYTNLGTGYAAFTYS